MSNLGNMWQRKRFSKQALCFWNRRARTQKDDRQSSRLHVPQHKWLVCSRLELYAPFWRGSLQITLLPCPFPWKVKRTSMNQLLFTAMLMKYMYFIMLQRWSHLSRRKRNYLNSICEANCVFKIGLGRKQGFFNRDIRPICMIGS